MYYFGYAPIRISHEVKYIYHNERIVFKEIISQEVYDDIEFELSGITDSEITIILLKKIIKNHWQEFKLEKFNDEMRRRKSFRLSFFLGFRERF